MNSLLFLVADLSVERVGAPLICSEFILRDWPEGKKPQLMYD